MKIQLAQDSGKNQIVQRVVAQLPWAHKVILIQKIKDLPTRFWYARQAVAQGWSRDTLAVMIKSRAHKRQGAAVTNFSLVEPEFANTDGFVVTIRRKPELAFKAVSGITGEVTGEVQRLLTVLVGEMKRTNIQEALALRHEDYFREAYLVPALTAGVIEMTIPGKPTSSKQKYRLTTKGRDLVAKLAKETGSDGK